MNPSLVEPGVKYFLSNTLRRCSENKTVYYNYLFNIGCFLFFVLGTSTFLYIKYKSHNNVEFKKKKKEMEEEYMVNLIHKIQTEKRIARGEKITDLPEFKSKTFI
tara:strand:+ start:7345 stop:7659 length:315 start_codon:yes stop_codon:yes gene_type:complete